MGILPFLRGLDRRTHAANCCFSFWAGGYSAKPDVGTVVAVCSEPVCGVGLHPLDGCERVLIEPLVPDSSVMALDIGVLLQLARLDVLDGDAACLGPLDQTIADVFRAVVNTDGKRCSPPFNDACSLKSRLLITMLICS